MTLVTSVKKEDENILTMYSADPAAYLRTNKTSVARLASVYLCFVNVSCLK